MGSDVEKSIQKVKIWSSIYICYDMGHMALPGMKGLTYEEWKKKFHADGLFCIGIEN